MTKKKIIHFVLSKEDDDIIRWKEALPKYTFNKYVNWILTAESHGNWAIVPCGYSSASIPDVVNGRLTVTNPDALAMIKKMKKMHVTERIKAIIREHLQYNSEHIKKATIVASDRLQSLNVAFTSKMAEKEKEYFGVPFKHKKLCDSYELAMIAYLEEIIQCLDSETNGIVNSKLMHFDCERIIKDSFDSVFNAPEESAEGVRENGDEDDDGYDIILEDDV